MTGFDNRMAESSARILLTGNSPGMSIAVSQGTRAATEHPSDGSAYAGDAVVPAEPWVVLRPTEARRWLYDPDRDNGADGLVKLIRFPDEAMGSFHDAGFPQ